MIGVGEEFNLSQTPKVVVLCPIYNDAWTLHRFLSVASTFADHIVVADQASTDGSQAICREFPKVILLDCPSDSLKTRRLLLVNEARKIEGPRLLLAIDADEILSSNLMTSIEWQTVLSSPPGTIIAITRFELWKTPLYYKPLTLVDRDRWLIFGFMDDGSEYDPGEGGTGAHGRVFPRYRLIETAGKRVLQLNEIVMLHYQFTDFQRAQSKCRWYLCLERSNDPERNPTQLHRFYTQYINENLRYPLQPVPREWLLGWQERSIDVTTVHRERYYWYDWEVLRMFEQHGTRIFRHEDIWCVDWEAIRQIGLEMGIPDLPQRPIKDPRTKLERYLTVLCRRTQNTKWQRPADIFLRLMGR